jgi:nucleoside-diphosphate-sugar epimerase
MRVFVAGATGVLGQPTVKLLIAAGHEVRGTARGEEKAQLLRSLGAEPVAVDLYDAEAVKKAVAGSEAVVHMATKIPALMKMRSRGAWKENDRLRREATKNLVDGALAAGAQRFIAESIVFTYADGGDRWLDENAPMKLAWSALDSAVDLEKETKRFGEGAVILRFGLFYAPYAASTIDSAKMMRRRMFGVIGKGENFFSSIHVDDAAAAVVAALGAPGGTYNIVEDNPVPQAEYAQAFAEELHLPKPRRFPRWLGKLVMGGPANYILNSTRVSNKKFKEATGWAPTYPSVHEGFREVAEMMGKS